MSVMCPSCGAADEAAAVHRLLLNDQSPLDLPTRALLSLPAQPGRTSGGATVLFLLAGVLGLISLHAFLFDHVGGSAAYQAGYHFGPIAIAVVLLGIGLGRVLRIIWSLVDVCR
ncbi:hypothetical protein [Kitasatospora sp. NPDC101183]|uniref:hypothetical protein n=1 Tax=Kitasatospora sp. NPDC101183 TaxID=3364100 RepID=UPI0037FDC073